MSRMIRRLALLSLCLGLLGTGCIYTSTVVFPSRSEALYVFYDKDSSRSYLTRLEFNRKRATIESEFERPVFALAMSRDARTLYYFELAKGERVEGKDDPTPDALALTKLSILDMDDPGASEFICALKLDSTAGMQYATTFGAARILPTPDGKALFVSYVEQEKVVKLCKVDLETGKPEYIDEKIALYPKLDRRGNYLGYLRVLPKKAPGADPEKQIFDCTVVVLDAATLKEVETKELGEWKIPPQFDFVPIRAEGYEVFYPVRQSKGDEPTPKGVSMDMHYLDSLECIAGSKKLAFYCSQNSDLMEVASLAGGVLEKFRRKSFAPLAWDPQCESFFLGRDNYLAQYVLGRREFVVYQFIPPGDESGKAEINSYMIKELPDIGKE